MSEIDHEGTYETVCPYCGYVNRDSWELDDNGEQWCGGCEREFRYERHVDVTYSTKRLEE